MNSIARAYLLRFYAGVPSLILDYSMTHDLFFSGHMLATSALCGTIRSVHILNHLCFRNNLAKLASQVYNFYFFLFLLFFLNDFYYYYYYYCYYFFLCFYI